MGFEFNKDSYLASLAYFHNDYYNRIVDNSRVGGYNRNVHRFFNARYSF
ncbi:MULTISPECIES: hypothetical protein [unclassified Eikenella]|nr:MULTISPECIES: hypothetical protein [unclassified Eikenella]